MWPTCASLLKVQSGLFGKVWQRLFLFSHREHCCSAVCTGITQEQWENTLILHQLRDELQPHLFLSGSCLCWPTSLAVLVPLEYRKAFNPVHLWTRWRRCCPSVLGKSCGLRIDVHLLNPCNADLRLFLLLWQYWEWGWGVQLCSDEMVAC